MADDVFVVETSLAQRSLWFVHEMDPGLPVYNVTGVVRIRGPLMPAALEQALNAVVARHEILRTSFEVEAGEPVQVIHPELHVTIPVTEMAEAGVPRAIEEEVGRPFDLAHVPLLRMSLLRLARDEHIAVLVMHHMVTDGWSAVILFSELSACYEAFIEERAARLDPLPIQYADYAVWENDTLRGNLLDGLIEYWSSQLAGAVPVQLPTDRLPGPELSFRGDTVTFTIPGQTMAEVSRFARDHGATPFMVLLAAWQAVLARESGQYDVAVACPVANRERPEIAGLIGYFVNTIIMRTDLTGDPAFLDVLERVRAVSTGALRHQQLPFGKLVEVLKPRRHAGPGVPFARVMFVLQNMASDPWKSGGLTLEPSWTATGTAKFEVTLSIEPAADGYLGALGYSTDLYDRATMERLSGQFLTLLRGALDDPACALSRLPLLTGEQRAAAVRAGLAARADLRPALMDVMTALAEGTASEPGEIGPGAGAGPDVHGGRPAAVDVHVLDERLEPVPAGLPGELYFGGPAIARGYRQDPACTAQRFVADPYAPSNGGRLYRTGQIARLRADGELEVLGAAARRVFVQGTPVQPERVETALSGHPDVADCAVRMWADAEHQEPGAYVVAAAGRDPDIDGLRRYLAARLPGTMVPARYKLVEQIRRTPAGAPDWAALPEFGQPSARAAVFPRTPIEQSIAGLVAGLIGLDQVDMNANFLELGGHSLLAVQLASSAREKFDVELPLRLLYEASLEDLARFVFDELIKTDPGAPGLT
jgi:acyl carrier protein